MGAEITGANAGSSGQSEKQRQQQQQQQPDRTSPASTEPHRTTADNHRTDTTAADRTAAGAATESGQKIPVVADVDLERQKERNRQKAESARRAAERKRCIAAGEPIPEWAQKKPAGGGGAKKTTKKKQEPEVVDTKSIKMLLTTVFGLIASREGAAHWALSEAEAEQLAQPIHDILSDYAAVSDALSENSKYIALAMAAFAICTPRIMMSAAISKKKKEQSNGIIAKPKHEQPARPEGNSPRKTESGSGGGSGTAAADGTGNSPSIFELIPAT